MAKLYADENFDYPAVEESRRLGHDVLTAQEAGQGNQRIADPAVLAFAASLGRDAKKGQVQLTGTALRVLRINWT